MRIFAGEWVRNILTRLGMEEGQAIESRMVSRRIEGAQKKVEERNFEIRKNLLEYDEVMDEQRKRVYGYRQQVLDGADCRELILEMIDGQVEHNVGEFMARDYGPETFAQWVRKRLSVEVDAHEFRDMDFETAEGYAKDLAERLAEGHVFDLIEENLPDDVDAREWNWSALAKAVNSRWQLGLRDSKLKQIGRDQLPEELLDKVVDVIRQTDLSEGAVYLDPDFGLRRTCGWVRAKFGIELDPEALRDLEPDALIEEIRQRARAAYAEKEADFPVMAVLAEATARDATGHKRYVREEVVRQVRSRFGVDLSVDDLKTKQRHEIEALLREQSRRHSEEGRQTAAEVQKRLAELFDGDRSPDSSLVSLRHDGQLRSLSNWLREKLQYDLAPEEMVGMERKDLEHRLQGVVEHRYRREMRRLERFLLLHHLDTAWKNHLLVMDHLRSSVGLRGYAQVDPKVEYKREGMRTFEEMWTSVGGRVTDMIFKTEQLPPALLASTFRETRAVHERAPGASEIAEQQQAAIDGTEADRKPEPFRRRQERVGRNDPCPCGSGKKYKKCCGRTG
jgi:preprotein translocase subunit SecA